MSADVSARPRALPGEPASLSALDRPAAIAPPPRVRYDRAGNPRKPRHSASMWRLRTYMRPYLGRFVLMVFFAFLGVGATVVIPLVTRAVIDGPVAQSDQAGLWALGLLAAGL